MNKRPIFVSGTTGCGKSELGIYLAKRFDGEIINCDSVQVYREAVIGAARVSDEQLAQVPHHLIGYCSPGDTYSLGQYLKDFSQIERDIESRGKRVIVVGGSTLYIRALIHGLANLPERNASLRAALELEATPELHSRLLQEDEALAKRFHPNDRLRIIRALEITSSQKSTALFEHEDTSKSRFDRTPVIVVPVWDRRILSERLHNRAQEMVANGLLEEVSSICSLYGKGCGLLTAVGYVQALRFLEQGDGNHCARGRLVDEILIASRRYAKRQLTFWRNEPIKMNWCLLELENYHLERVGDDAVDVSSFKKGRKGVGAYSLSIDELQTVLARYLTDASCQMPTVLYVAGSALGKV